MITRVDYWYDKEMPENTGWYICHYANVDDMLMKSPEDVIGPFDTEAEGKRVLAETTDLDKDSESIARKKAYDPSRDPAPASLKTSFDAGIPTDNDEADNFPDGESEGVQLELQQTQELRDVPPKIQGD